MFLTYEKPYLPLVGFLFQEIWKGNSTSSSIPVHEKSFSGPETPFQGRWMSGSVGGRFSRGGNFTVLSGRGDAPLPVLVEDQHGGATLETRISSLARPVPVAGLA